MSCKYFDKFPSPADSYSHIPDILACRLIEWTMNISCPGLQRPLSAHAQTLTVNWLIGIHLHMWMQSLCKSINICVYKAMTADPRHGNNVTSKWIFWKFLLFISILKVAIMWHQTEFSGNFFCLVILKVRIMWHKTVILHIQHWFPTFAPATIAPPSIP